MLVSEAALGYGGAKMPGDPRACREHARRSAELAALVATPEEREHFLSLERAPGSDLPLSLRVPRHFSTQWTRLILRSLTRLRRPDQQHDVKFYRSRYSVTEGSARQKPALRSRLLVKECDDLISSTRYAIEMCSARQPPKTHFACGERAALPSSITARG